MTDTIAKLQSENNKLIAAIEEELSKHDAATLVDLAEQHIQNPMMVTRAAVLMDSPKVAVMAGCMIRQVLLRRLEAREMERAIG